MNKKLVAVVGTSAAGMLLYFTPQFEGVVLRGYADPIGIVTACVGHTATAVLGKPYTKAECDRLLEQDLIEHAQGVLDCVPAEKLNTGRKAAAVSFAFNVGVSKFCGSTFARKLREGDSTACAELSRWTYAGGRELPGLIKRRATERAICEGV